MQYRPLGSSGLRISEVSLGSWLTFGNAVDEGKSVACVRRAHELGINFFDTADVYADGEAERVLGRALSAFPRDSFVVGTKCFFPRVRDRARRGLGRTHVLASVDESLGNLGLDAIDLMQCHRFDPETPLEETVQAMGDAMAAGKVRHWGVSRWTAAQMAEASAIASSLGVPAPVSHQPPYNALNRSAEEEFAATAALGVGIVVYSPLAQGVLTGKYAEGVPSGSRGANAGTRDGMWDLKPAQIVRSARFRGVAQGLGIEAAALALAWCLRRPEVTSTIVGASRPEQLDANIRASGLKYGDDVWAAVDSALAATEEG
ncbi:MAG: aldo/keto reductase [Polyangiales bacterium]